MRNIYSPRTTPRPRALRLGSLLLALGLALDLGYHAALGIGGGHASHSSPFATATHVLVLIGMGVTFAGVLQVAFKRQAIVERKETR